MTGSCLFAGEVVHVRRRPTFHRLSYRIFMGLFDLDELPALSRNIRLFGYNRAALFSFHDRDHGDGSGHPLRPQVEQALADAGIEPPGGPIRILCMPRLLGYVFNPISVYFCHDRAGRLCATVHEVNNTFGERHFYALPAVAGYDGRVRQDCMKQFRVSPFLPMDLDYRFVIVPPDETTSVSIAARRDDEDILIAWFNGRRHPLNDAALARQWLTHPAMTWKVIAGIHWEALFLWRKLRRGKSTITAPAPSIK
ncbi:hypothetical protein MB02_14105 [Croceicoccus estronivorus]|uniref:DUF1365 domain-containing protein n=1 Tax=Croceicoccus estronivorus TaxID=1172626 RepID=UPI00082BDAE3|nr:DUF1365 family protein [Croceicoccus estronivorus]OCC22899.1 hypothetical protein MB02_14105 [Croceicoccus estronivorus]